MVLNDISKELSRLATSHGLAKDVVDLLVQKAAILEQQNLSLTQENASLKQENADLRAETANRNRCFDEIDGLLWKRNATGYEPRPYCPVCTDHPVMSAFPPHSRSMWACPRDHTFDYATHPTIP